jgi:type IV conjugative transfer system lipoprotein TraV
MNRIILIFRLNKKCILLYLLLILIFLSSCSSTTSSSWDCPRQNGVGCININGADNSHNLGLNSNYSNNKNNNNYTKCDKACKKRKKQLLKNLKLKEHKQSLSKNLLLKDKETFSLRSSEKVSRVLFSSFIDEQGNNHDESIVYYVDEQPSWIR